MLQLNLIVSEELAQSATTEALNGKTSGRVFEFNTKRKAFKPVLCENEEAVFRYFTDARTVGSGSFGSVFHVRGRLYGDNELALKKVPCADKDGEGYPTDHRLFNELQLMGLLSHPGIVPLLDVFVTPAHLYILMPFFAGGDLYNYLTRRGALPEPEAAHLFRECVAAVKFLHDSHIAHRDIKLENLFLTSPPPSRTHCVIGDLGFATVFRSDLTRGSRIGSIYYAAPELLTGKPYVGPELDVWALGIVLFALCTASLPFVHEDEAKRRRALLAGRVVFPPHLSMTFIDLFRGMCAVDPARRLSIDEVLLHPWLRGYTQQARLDASGGSLGGSRDGLATRPALAGSGAHSPLRGRSAGSSGHKRGASETPGDLWLGLLAAEDDPKSSSSVWSDLARSSSSNKETGDIYDQLTALPSDPKEWDESEVLLWLAKRDLGALQYTCAREHVCGEDLLALTRKQTHALAENSALARRLWREVEALKRERAAMERSVEYVLPSGEVRRCPAPRKVDWARKMSRRSVVEDAQEQIPELRGKAVALAGKGGGGMEDVVMLESSKELRKYLRKAWKADKVPKLFLLEKK